MTGVGSGPEMDLISDSVASATARIKFFRVAFGAANQQMMGFPEINEILRGYYNGSRWQVDWASSSAQPRADVRLCLLGLLCFETGMPYGGDIRLEKSGPRWSMTGQAKKMNIDPDLWGVLATQTPGIKLRPAQVQFGLLPAVARDDGRQITSKIVENEITISF